MLVAALFATHSSANTATMASSRISFGMGRGLVLPCWFGKAHPVHKTPSNGIIFSGGFAILLSMTGKAKILAEIFSAMFMISYTLLSISVLVLRRVKPNWHQPAFRAPLFPVIPVVTVILSLGVILTMDTFSQVAGIGLLAICLCWYLFWVRKNALINRARAADGTAHRGCRTHRSKW